MSAELKPCPFCGDAPKMQTDGESGYWIECTNAGCGSSTNMRIALMDDVSVVLAEQWNRRATPATAELVVEERDTPYPYDALFRAIGDATKITAGALAVSVKQFVETLAGNGYQVVSASRDQQPAGVQGEAIHQVASQLHPNGWHDCSADDAEGHRRAGFKTRIVYTTPPDPARFGESVDTPEFRKRFEYMLRDEYAQLVADIDAWAARRAAGGTMLPVGTLAWALIATNGNIIIWSRNHSTVEGYQSKYPTATLTPIIGAAGTAGDHWMLVPKMATLNMRKAAAHLADKRDVYLNTNDASAIYDAMLAAAPSATADDEGEEAA